MIRIGFGPRQKERIVNEYISKHNIQRVFLLYSEKQEQSLKFSLPHEAVEYNEWEMYRTYYPMIEKVDSESLIVVNDALRTTDYSDLKINCATMWLRQTNHRIVFNMLPFIEKVDDFRLLQKLDQGSKSVDLFDYVQLQTQDIVVKPHRIKLEVIEMIRTTEKQKVAYKKLKDATSKILEEDITKDPDILPRKLALKAGDFKKSIIEDGVQYIARNKRFKCENVASMSDYDASVRHVFLDFPISRIQFVDYIMKTKVNTIPFVSTDLSIDNYLVSDFAKWKARLDAFYAQANTHK